MHTYRRTRPAGAPAYYLGRSATRWLDAVERRHPRPRPASSHYETHGRRAA
jgi:hypothetical protein